jgi:phosphate transport system substrate-binding protein
MLFGRSRLFLLASLLAIVAFAAILAACGDDDDDTDASGTPTAAGETSPPATNGGDGIDYGSLEGEINIDGSSTVYPITFAMAEEFSGVAPDVLVNVAFSGTGGGFEAFCAGDIEIADASRPIRDNDDPAEPGEVQDCAANGIEDILEIQVGIDALTVMVHPDNDFVECLTIQQLFDIFTGAATNWNQVDPSFPDQAIGDSLYYPGTDSGTFDYFVEAIIEEIDDTAAHTGNGTSSEDDNILAQGIEGDTNGIGYFGFAYFQDAGQALKAVEIDAGEGCVAPSFETALDGSYYLSRPLYIYTRESFLDDPDSPVLGFVSFYLESVEAIVPEVGYVSLPEDVLADQVAKIEPFLP